MRFVVATLYPFGLKRGVGLDTLSAFFVRLRLESQRGRSPTALRGVMQTMAATMLETAAAWEQDGVAAGEVRDIIGAVDETCLEHLMLVFQDVSTGSLLLEAVADDRTYATWKTVGDQRLAEWGAGVLSLVSDRAKALIQRAAQGLECLSMPDVLHGVHEIVKSYALAMGRRLRQARQALTHAEEILAHHVARAHTVPHSPDAQAHVEAKRAEGQQWEDVQRTYRPHLEPLSLTLHPLGIADSVPQTSAQVARQRHTAVEAIEACAHRQQLPARHDAMKQVRTPLPALAALVDGWWHGVRQDLAPCVLSPQWGQWVHTCLLPMVSWDHQGTRTRCRRRKARIRQALEAVRTAFERHPIPLRLAPHVLAAGQGWAIDRVKSFQRTSSAVEGRNGSLSQMQHTQRGLPKQRDKVWAVLHHFDGRAADGTTPAARFFRRTFPDLFETVLSPIEVLPRARQRKDEVALRH